jgi:hypothetical protein
MAMLKKPIINNTFIQRYTESLRFPSLVALIAVVFVLDLFIPDIIPFADEIVLGLLLAGLSRLKRKTP